jgi:starvation-inducible DNA-binding protein
MKPRIGIPDENLQKVANILNVLLADEVVLYMKTRNYHWNVKRPDFSELHKFFENQYEQLAEIMDTVAERTRMIGHYAIGTLSGALKSTRLLEGQDESTADKMIANLLEDHETIIRSIRHEIDVVSEMKDYGTADFITGVMEAHEKMAWMLRSYLG